MPPPRQKEAILPEDLIATLETLDRATLHDLRDPAMLVLGFAGGPRRSEILGLEVGRGWIEFFPRQRPVGGAQGKNRMAWARDRPGSADAPCPYVAVQSWMKFARIASWPSLPAGDRSGKEGGDERLNDQEVARLVKRAALAAGVRGNLSEESGTSCLRAIYCARASLHRSRATSAMCRNSLVMPVPR